MPHRQGRRGAHRAARFSPDPEVVSLLAARGARLKAVDRMGLTPLRLVSPTPLWMRSVVAPASVRFHCAWSSPAARRRAPRDGAGMRRQSRAGNACTMATSGTGEHR